MLSAAYGAWAGVRGAGAGGRVRSAVLLAWWKFSPADCSGCCPGQRRRPGVVLQKSFLLQKAIHKVSPLVSWNRGVWFVLRTTATVL